MRILFLTHYFPPESNAPAVRTHEHCREWVKAGHEVHVVTCIPNHPRGEPFDGYRPAAKVQSEVIDGINVHRIWTYIAPNRGVIKRTLGYVSFMLSVPFALKSLPKPDVIIATSPQFFCACAGYLAGKIMRRPWIFELRDLWPESIAAVGAIHAKMVLKFFEMIEIGLYRDARAVVSLTNSFKDNLVSRGIPADKIHIVPNGVNPAEWDGVETNHEHRPDGINGEFLVSYIGTHGMAHNLDTLLEAANILKEKNDIRFLTVGDGAEFEALKQRKDEMGLENVTMTGLVPHDDARRYLETSDASVVILRRSELFKTVIPSKMFEAMAARKPIILAVEGEARRIVNEAGAGICVEPENPEQLADAVLTLRDDRRLKEKLGKNGRDAVKEQFNRKLLANDMLEVVYAAGNGTS